MTTERHLLRDLRLDLLHQELRPVYTVATEQRRVPNKAGRFQDFATVGGKDNLAQAVVMRLLTPRGELAALGHPEYGSRLHELIGRENNETNRDLVRLYILESLQREPRIARVQLVSVEQNMDYRERVNVLLRVAPAVGNGTVTIGPFTLEF